MTRSVEEETTGLRINQGIEAAVSIEAAGLGPELKIADIESRLTEIKRGIVVQMLKMIHSLDEPIDSFELDEILGIDSFKAERRMDYARLHEVYPGEEFWERAFYKWTPYNFVRVILRKLELTASDCLYDLGSGYGRVPIYAALLTEAQCRGIEIVPERVRESMGVKKNLEIGNLEFEQGNVLECDFSEGNVFFLFNPFAEETLRRVNERLKEIAQSKPIRIVSLGNTSSFFGQQEWLSLLDAEEDMWDMAVFESNE